MIPFNSPRIDQRIVDEVVDTLRSKWISTGPKTRKFEKMLTAYGGHKATLCVSSASAGLEMMLRWYGVKAGDEVIVPAYTYPATANVVVHCGAKVVFVDVNRDFSIDIKAAEKAITAHTKVIMPVDVAGWPCDYDAIHAMIRKPEVQKLFKPATKEQQMLNRILVLSDAAHSIGGQYNEKKVGNLTDISVYSFHAVKNITTAEGGAVCLNLPEPFNHKTLCRDLNALTMHGQTMDALAKTTTGEWRYDIIEPGYKYNMTDIQASFGLVELPRYDDDMLCRRKQIFDRYALAFSEYPWAQIPEYACERRKSSYHLFLLRIFGVTEIQRDRIILEIFKRDVTVNVHFVPLPMMTYYRQEGYDIKNYPVAYDNYSREISLPVFYDLTDDMVDTVVKAVTESVNMIIC